jgi:hypothetical protein
MGRPDKQSVFGAGHCISCSLKKDSFFWRDGLEVYNRQPRLMSNIAVAVTIGDFFRGSLEIVCDAEYIVRCENNIFAILTAFTAGFTAKHHPIVKTQARQLHYLLILHRTYITHLFAPFLYYFLLFLCKMVALTMATPP